MFGPYEIRQMNARSQAEFLQRGFPTTNNTFVPKAWSLGQKSRNGSGSFWTDGERLYSYGLVIGETLDGVKVLYDFRSPYFVSIKTSRHVSQAGGSAQRLIDPPALTYV